MTTKPVKPLSYRQQSDNYDLMCESAVMQCPSGIEYREALKQIRAELRKDPAYVLLVKNKFRPPAPQCGRSKGVVDQATIENFVTSQA